MFDINKISISFDGKKIVFQYIIVEDDNNNVINNNNELLFDKNYFSNNKKIISNIISGIILEKDISTVSVIDYNLVIPVIDIVNNIKKITTLNIVENKEMTNSVCEKLLKSKYIKNVNCHQAPIYMLDNLDKKNIKVNFRVQYLSDSHFGMKNKLYSYSRMYYKNTLNFDKLLNEKDIQELQMFLSINNYLKKINIYNFSFDLVKQVINELCKNFKGNIQILIRANSENVGYIQESIPYLKTLNKIYKEKLNIRFKIEYSNEYRKKNKIKQFSNNVLLVSCLIIAIVSTFGLGIIQYNDYMTKKQSEEIKEITKVEINNENETTTPEEEVPEEDNNTIDSEDTNTTNNNSSNTNNKPNLTEDYQKLLSLNNETVGWLKVNNTRVDYPVVKASDNDYYLNHNFYKQNNFNGWIYMDYRNNPEVLDQNTIIYGHNLKNGMMFGSLQNARNSWWYDNEENLTITFNTSTKQMKWQIFSIYVVNVTNDYLYANFEYDTQFEEFANKLRSRSIKDFGVNVTKFDKILTLTTCQNNGEQRLVIHAKLIN